LEVSTTLPPWQKDSGPFADITGAAGGAVTVVTMLEEVIEQAPLVTVTLKVPAVFTMMERVVSPVDHVFL
jgi:hypothetical protein